MIKAAMESLASQAFQGRKEKLAMSVLPDNQGFQGSRDSWACRVTTAYLEYLDAMGPMVKMASPELLEERDRKATQVRRCEVVRA